MSVSENPVLSRTLFTLGVLLVVMSLIAIALLIPSASSGSPQALLELLVSMMVLGIGVSIATCIAIAVRSRVSGRGAGIRKYVAAIVIIFASLFCAWLAAYASISWLHSASTPTSTGVSSFVPTQPRYLAPWPPIGVSYHVYEQPSESTWRRDLETMARLGIRFVRLFYVAPTNAAWPMDGLDNETLDEFLSLCDELGMKVVVTIAQYVPQWAPPNVTMVTQWGWGFQWWPSPCSRYWLKYMEKFVEEVVRVAKKHRCVVAYNVLNEYHAPENMYWDNKLCDYNPACLREFRRWCQRLGVNASLCEPVRVETSDWLSWNLSAEWIARWYLWRLFVAEEIANFTKALVSEIHRLDPSRPVIVNEMPWWFWSQGGYAAVSPAITLSVGEDYAAIDIYPAEPEGGWIAMALDSVRSLSRPRLGFGVLELNEKRGAATPYEVANWVAMSLQLGSSFVGWFEWDDRFAGMDGGSYGLVDRYKELKPVATYLRYAIAGLEKLRSCVEGFARVYLGKKSVVAMLYSEPNQMLVSSDWFVAFDWLAAYKLFSFGLGYKVDFVYANLSSVSSLSGYRMLVAPAQFFVSCKALREIADWVKRGGVLVVDSYFGYLSPCRSLVEELLGAKIAGGSGLGNRTFYAQLCVNGSCVLAHGYLELLKPVTARVVARYGGVPIVLVNKLGEGCVIAFAIPLHDAFYNPDAWGQIVSSVLKLANAPKSSGISKVALLARKAFACAIQRWVEGENASSILAKLGSVWSEANRELSTTGRVSPKTMTALRELEESACG